MFLPISNILPDTKDTNTFTKSKRDNISCKYSFNIQSFIKNVYYTFLTNETTGHEALKFNIFQSCNVTRHKQVIISNLKLGLFIFSQIIFQKLFFLIFVKTLI